VTASAPGAPPASPPASPPSPPGKPSPYAIFRNRYFTYLWTGQLISTIGDALTSLAAGIFVYEITGSVLSVGLILMASAAPTLLFGLIAGVIVDRYDRKTIMIVSSLLRAVLVGLIPVLVLGGDDIIWLYVLVLGSASVQQFFDPANDSVLPEVATDEELGAANSLMAIAQFGSTAIGFALAGLITAQFNIAIAFWLDAATFVISAALIFLVKIKPLVVEELTTVRDVIRNLGFGAGFIWKVPILRSMTLLRIPVMLIFGLQNVLLLPFAFKVLGAGEFEYGLQEGITSVGFVVGSLLMASYADRLREGSWLVLSFLGMGIAGLLYALSSNIWLAIGLIGISGVLNAPSFVAGRLINQRNTPREMRGRVFSTNYVIRDVVYLAGMALAGLADVIDVQLLFVASSTALIVTSLVGALLPGIGQPAAEWRRTMTLLRTAPKAAFGVARPATAADIEALGRYIPALAGMPQRDRDALVSHGRVVTAEAGTAITKAGETGDNAYFILDGRAVAGLTNPEGEHRALSTMGIGDVFGEIAALTGSVRTADVVADEPTELLEVPADTLRQLMRQPEFSALVLGKMQERLSRSTSIADLPRFGRLDQQALRELREESAASEGSPAAA
jgi:CRP-like cAMP-binding protein/sugar phosphate permease